jgi:hypothetical protein
LWEIDLNKDSESFSLLSDHVFDLEHNNGMIFDKQPERVKLGYGKDKEFLDFKREAPDLDTLITGTKLFISSKMYKELESKVRRFKKIQNRVEKK